MLRVRKAINAESNLVMLALWNRLAVVAGEMFELPSGCAQLVTLDRRRSDNPLGGLRRAKVSVKMNGLRVYVNGVTAEVHSGRTVFYSRREDGPFYRWSYDDDARQWRVDRVLKSGVSAKTLSSKPWKDIPTGLQRSIIEHYQD
jgi:hypothetical protein